ncbi:MAG: glycosyltransferase family 4 protein [Patescibacteria group bacterium]
MKIAYLINNLNSKNGWGRYASDLIYGVKKSGHEIVILKEEDDGLEGMPILRRGIRVFTPAFKIKKLLKDCDIIHALDGYPYGVIGAIANTGLSKKLIITGVGTYAVEPLYNFRTSLLLKWAYKKANQIITISNFTKSEIIKKIRLENIKVINPGINFEKFYRPHIKTDEKFILSVGALKFRKGYHISIPAFVLAKKEIPDLKYKIVGNQGDKSYFGHLKKLVKDNNIGNDIGFLEEMGDEELKKLYQTAKLFVLTSINHNYHFEGFGLGFLEAAAAGLPVIGTLGNGIGDAVKNGYNGILIPQKNIEKTAEAILEIINSKKYYQMSQASLEWAQSHNLNKTVDEYLKVYKEIL